MNGIVACVFGALLAASFPVFDKPAQPRQKEPLRLVQKIPMPNVRGRIDHFSFDPSHNRVIVAALGNNTVEVVDPHAGRDIHRITGAATPQGVVFVSDLNKLFVANGGDGSLRAYDGNSFKLLSNIEIGEDADNVRYDSKTKRILVGYGGEEQGGIAVVEASTSKRLEDIARLDAHPESFQIAASKPAIYVNVADKAKVAAVDTQTRKIAEWPLKVAKANFPMALDEPDRRVFVATRRPAQLIVLNLDTGSQVTSVACVGDADDLYYDKQRKRIYVAGGEGFISVIQQTDPDHYETLGKIPTAAGARTGMWSDAQDRFYLAVPARSGHAAALWVYSPEQ